MRWTTELKVNLLKDEGAFYSTHESIQGYMSLQFEHDTVIDEVDISLVGKTSIRVEKHILLSDQIGYTHGDHTFLKTSYPIQATDLPDDNLARVGQSYTIPFSFVVPDRLLPYACTHSTKKGNTVRETHLLLPPSLGTPQTNKIFVEDITPDRARVAYCIQVQVRKRLPNGCPITLRRACPVCIIPVREEEPPMLIDDDDRYFRLSNGKSVSRGLPGVCRSIGRVTACTTELSALTLLHARQDVEDLPTIQIPVDLFFQPTSQREQPPLLYSVNAKLRCFTFFGALPYKIIPRPGDYYGDRAEYSYYMSTTRLGNQYLRDVEWTKQGTVKGTEKDEFLQDHLHSEELAASGLSALTDDIDGSGVRYGTSLRIPVSLSKHAQRSSKRKFFIPTFSSCLLSRAYSLELKISYQAAAASSAQSSKDVCCTNSVVRFLTPRSHLVLKVPLQIRVENDASHSPEVMASNAEGCPHDRSVNKLIVEQRPPQYTRTCLPD